MAHPRRYTHRPIETCRRIKIINPIHPLFGTEVECIDIYRKNGLLEVFIRHPVDTDVQGLPAWATDVNGPVSFNEKPNSLILFRADLLLKTLEKTRSLTDRLSCKSEGCHASCPPAATPSAAARGAASVTSPDDADGHFDTPPVRRGESSRGDQT